MNQIKNLHVQGFRRLRDVQFDVRPLIVLIGANGVGKTSVLDVFSMLSSAAKGELNSWLTEHGGLPSVLTLDRAKDLSIGLKVAVSDSSPLEYNLKLVPIGTIYGLESESLTQPDPQDEAKVIKHIDAHYDSVSYYSLSLRDQMVHLWSGRNRNETSLSQAPQTLETPVLVRNALASCKLYHTLSVEAWAKVRQPQTMSPAFSPGSDGEYLVPFLYNMREIYPDRFERVEDALRSAFPSFDGLGFPPVAAGTMAMTWKDKNYTTPIYMHQLAEGMLRFLWLTSLLQSPGLPAITMIDEPEVSLHPELLSLLADLLREASQRTQLIVATQSDRLVGFLEPNEVLVMDQQENGDATMTWADTMDLDIWLADYSLDEVWRMGRMGGRS